MIRAKEWRSGGLRAARRRARHSLPRRVAQDPARHRPRRGRDAAGAARDLARPPQLRDPARFDAWSYRLLVRACYAEGRRPASGRRTWILPADEPTGADGSSWSSIGTSSSGIPAPVDRPPRWWSCTTTPTCRSSGSPRAWRSRSGRSVPDFITRCAACARRSMPTHARPDGGFPMSTERDPHPHRPVVAGRGRHERSRTASWTSCSTRSPRPHSAAPGGWRGGPQP